MRIGRGYVDVPHGQVHMRFAGDHGDTVVLLHQTASSSRMFEPVMTELSRDFRVIAFDTPGFGESDPCPNAPTIPELVEVLHDALTRLGVEQYHIMGHHTGAALAAEWASGRPDEVRTVTMVGALALGKAEREAWHRSITSAEIRADGEHFEAAWHRVASIDRIPVKYPPAPALRHREAVDVLLATPRWPEAYLAVFSHDTADAISRVQCPQLLICGTEDILWDYFDATAALMSKGTVFTLDAGAYVLEQHLDVVLPVIHDFLTQATLNTPGDRAIEQEYP